MTAPETRRESGARHSGTHGHALTPVARERDPGARDTELADEGCAGGERRRIPEARVDLRRVGPFARL